MLLFIFQIAGFISLKAQDADYYDFIASSGTYTPVTGTGLTFSSADDASTTITLPFTFNYCGNNYTSLVVCTNGMVTFGTAVSLSNSLASTTYINVLAPFWDDLSSSSTSGHISYYTEGTAPNQILTIQYSDVYRLSASSYLLNFQIKLYETTNVIEFVYGSGFTNFSYNTTTASIGINSFINSATYYVSITPTGSGTATSSTAFPNDVINDIVSHNLTSGTTYTFTPPTAICTRVSNILSSNITTTSADIQWTAGGSETQWAVEYKITTDTSWTVAGTTSTPSYSLTSLLPGLRYQVQVRPICGSGSEGPWRGHNFTTACDLIYTLPYTENFDTYGVSGATYYPTCWTRNTNYTTTYPYISSSYSFNSPGSLYFYATTTYYSYAISPQFDAAIDLSTLQITFQALKNSTTTTYGRLDVGIMSDPADLTSFTVIRSITSTDYPATLTWYEFEVPLNTYTGTGNYIAFRSPNEGTSYLYLDNVVVNTIPNCIKPIQVIVSNLGQQSCDVRWTPRGNETSWDVVCVPHGNDPSTGTPTTVYDTTTTISGLTSNTQYDVFVRANCGTEVSVWSTIVSFYTLCDALLSMPYTDSFDTYGTGTGTFPNCWTKYYSGSTSTYPYISTTNFSSPGSLYMYATSPYYTMAIGPQIDASIPVNTLECRFKSYITSTSYNLQIGVMTDVADPSTFTLIKTIIPRATSVWEDQTVYFNNYTGTGEFIAFKSGNSLATNIAYMDNLTIDYAPTCSEPLHLNISNIGGTSAFATWDAGTIGTPSQYIIEYSEAGMNNWTTQYSTDEYYFITGLSQTTAYDVRLYSVCGMGDISDTIYNTFTTGCSEGGTTQVGEGTITNYYIPVNNYYNYTYSQQIYLPSEVGSAGNIEGIAYQYAYTSPSTSKNNVNIYLGHTSRNSFSSNSDYIPLSSLQLVYSGDLNCSQGWNTFTFDSVFQYNGIDNLVVAIDDNSGSYNGSSYTFYVHQPGSYKSLYFYSDSYNPDPTNLTGYQGTIVYSSGYRSNTRFISPCVTSSCPHPNLVISGYTAFDANLLWAPGGSETSWELEFRAANDTDWTSLGTLTTTSYFLTGLNSNTEYNVRLRAVCSGSEQSTWEMETFRTECSSIVTLPYTETFDTYGTTSYTSYPNCWYRLTNYSSQYPYISSSYAASAPGSLYFYATTSYFSYAIAPEVDASIPVSNLMVTLKACVTSTTTTYGRFDVGVMTDPADFSTFTVVKSFRSTDFPSTATWYEFEILMNSYTGTGQYIAVRSPNEGSSYVYIDDVVIDNIPTCLRPERVRATNMTSSSADILWHSRGTESVWEIAYGTAGFDLSTATPVAVYDTLYNLTGLLPNTAYQVYVRSDCSSEYSRWTPVYTFITPCAAVNTLPYSENFDTYGSGSSVMPNCWTRFTTQTDRPYVNTSYYVSSPASLYFYNTSTTYSYASTPQIDVAFPMNTLQATFKLYKTSAAYSIEIGVMSNPNDITTYTPIDTISPLLTSTWEEYTVSFENYTGTGQYVTFKSGTGATNYMYLDNLVIDIIPACPIPSNLAADTCNGSSVTLSWIEHGVATSWEIEYGPTGFIHGSGTVVTATSNPFPVTGLIPNSSYEFYVRADCGTGEFSPWSSPLSLFTFQEFSGTTHFEPFEAYNVGDRLAAAAIAMGRTYWTTWDQVPDSLDDAVITTEQVNEGSKALKTVDGNDNVFLFPTLTNGTHIFEFDMYIGTGSSGYFNALQTFDGANSTFGFQAYFNATGTGTVDGNGTSAATFTYPQGAWFHPALVVDLDNDRAYFYINNSLIHSYQWSRGTFGTGTRTINALDFFGNTGNIYYLDNLDTTSIYPSCQRPDSIQISNVTANSVDLSWVQHGSATSWNIEYGPVGFARGTGTLIAGATNPQTIPGLTSSTAYDFYIQADCGGNDLSRWTTVQTFMTTQLVAVVPYICDFEDPLENVNWSYANGSQVNKWYIGTAANNTVGGTRSLYISKNYGATNEYYNSSVCYVWAFRDIYFSPTTGDYKLRFDWRAQGESTNYDYIKVYIGNVANVTAGSSTPPAGATQIGTIYNLHNTWQSDSINLPSSYANTTKRLYFMWYNDASGGTNPPGAIDNIAVTINTCPTPTGLVLTGITNTTADLSWVPGNNETSWNIEYGAAGFAHGTGTFATVTDTFYNIAGLTANTNYDFYVQANCGGGDVGPWRMITFRTACDPITAADLPYSEPFDTYGAGSTSYFPTCWTRMSTYSTNYPYISSTNFTPPGSLYFYASSSTYTIAVTDLIDASLPINTLKLDFKLYGSNTTYPFQIGVMTSPTNPATFVPVDTVYVTATSTFQDNEVFMNSYQGTGQYIAFKHTNSSSFYMDNLVIDVIPTCPRPTNLTVGNINPNSAEVSWTSHGTETAWEIQYKLVSDATWTLVQTTTNPYTLSGLSDASCYEVKVRAVCGTGDSSRFSNTFSFCTSCFGFSTFPYTQGFENGGTIPACWTESLVSGSTHWAYQAGGYSGNPSGAHTGSYNAYLFYSGSGQVAKLISPTFDFTNVTNPKLSFWHAQATWAGDQDILKVYYRVSPADPWVQLMSFTNSITTWQFDTIALPNTSATYSIAFEGDAEYGYGVVLDDITIDGISGPIDTCDNPINLAIPSATLACDSAIANWAAGGSETMWTFEYKRNTDADYTSVVVTTPTYTMTGLMQLTQYNVRVKALCGASDESGYTTANFTTPQCGVTSYIITASASPGGAISPSGAISVVAGGSQTFTMTPDDTSHVLWSLVVDGVEGPALSVYSFNGVNANHTIHANFVHTGINENNLQNSVIIFPNPANDLLNVKLSQEFESVEITNMLGQLLYSNKVTDSFLQIDISSYTSGVYFIRLKGDNGVATKKFIKE